jgi:hypothetical protein
MDLEIAAAGPQKFNFGVADLRRSVFFNVLDPDPPGFAFIWPGSGSVGGIQEHVN